MNPYTLPYLVLLFVFFVKLAPLQAQGLNIQNLPPNDELSQEQIRDFAQDSLGFIWIATTNGLIKFDGNHYTSYFHSPADSNSLVRNYVHTLYVDRFDPYLWIGTEDGLSRFHLETEVFTNYRHEPHNPHRQTANDIISITQDDQSRIWMGTGYYGVVRLDNTTGKFISVPVAGSSSNNRFTRDIFLGNDGWLWYSIGRHLGRVHPGSEQSQEYQAEIGMVLEGFHSTYQDQSGHIWVLTERGIFRYNYERQDFEQHPFRPDVFNREFGEESEWSELSVNGFLVDSQGQIWVGALQTFGVFLIDGNGAVTRVQEGKDPNGVPHSTLWGTFEDSQKNVWLGFWQGYKIVNPISEKFRLLQIKDPTSGYPRISNVFSVAVDDQEKIYVGYDSPRMLRYDPVNEKSDFYFPSENDPNSIPNDWVTSMIYQDGNIWLQANNRSRRRYDPATQKFYPIPQSDTTLVNLSKRGEIFPEKNGRLWFTGYEENKAGLYLYDPSDGSILKRLPLPAIQAIKEWSASRLIEDHAGFLWLGTEGAGLYRYDKLTQTWAAFLQGLDNQGLSGNSVKGLTEDEMGHIWVALSDSGLDQLINPHEDPEKVRIHHYNATNFALPVNSIIDILSDDLGYVWIATNKGLSRLDPRDLAIANFGLNENLQTFRNSKFCKASDGTIYIGGKLGVTIFNPQRFEFNQQEPAVRLTDFRLFNQSVPIKGREPDDLGYDSPLEKTISYTESIRLSHWQNDLTFEFAAINYIHPEKNSYWYKLEGVDPDWKSTAADYPQVNYQRLSPGKYTLQVKAVNNDGVRSASTTSIQIIISPPWWRTWWAYVLYIISTIALVYLAGRYELNRKLAQAKAQQQEALNQLQSKLYTNITHEFRTPLTIVLGISDHLKEQVSEHAKAGLEMIRRNGSQLLRLVNQLLDLSKLESGHLELVVEQGDIIRYLKYLQDTFQTLADPKNIRLHFTSDLNEFFMDFDPVRVNHVVSNLLSNAIKFTPQNGDVYISVQLSRYSAPSGPKNNDGIPAYPTPLPSLVIKIEDTGIGIPAAQVSQVFDRFYQVDASNTRRGEGTGIGLTLTKELVKLMGGIIAVKSEVGKGTVFTLTLPVSKKAPIVHVEDQIGTLEERVIVPEPMLTGETENPVLLIVEDNLDLIYYLREALAPSYNILIARNGQEGIEQAIATIPDLIISDVMMPDKDGFDLTRTLKKDMRTSHIPIILLTAKADIASRIEGLEYGADAYISKPFYLKELMVRLRKLLELRNELQQKYGEFTTYPPFPYAAKAKHLSLDEQFLRDAVSIVNENLADENFGSPQLQKALQISRSQLHRKLKALTDQSATQFIRNIRLQKARQLLQTTQFTVSEIAYEVGFKDPVYFTQSFSEKFGRPPSKFRT